MDLNGVIGSPIYFHDQGARMIHFRFGHNLLSIKAEIGIALNKLSADSLAVNIR
jgi:hypothetical protein